MSMFIFTRNFLHDFRFNPKQALESLKQRKSRFVYPCVKFLVFWRIVFSEYFLNACITRASALAYALLLTLIPLLAVVAFMAASIMDIHPKQVEALLSHFLPFAPKTVLEYISSFFSNAKKLRGIGIFGFIIVSVGLFGLVEGSLNTIWKVVHSRSFFVRLRSFTMVMVYSPLLFFASFQIRRSVWLDLMSGYFFPVDIVPFLLTVLAFTVFIWIVPNTKVPFKSAFLGGIVAGGLFELERHWFDSYVHLSMQAQSIYGAFGILLFFLVSLFVLFGAEVAYVHQNFPPLVRAKTRWDRRVGDYRMYFALRIMIDAISSFYFKRPPPSLAQFMKKFEMTETQAQGIIKSLIRNGFLHVVGGKDVYVPTRDFSQTLVVEVVDAIEDEGRKIAVSPDDYAKMFLSKFIAKTRCRNTTDAYGELTFEKLVLELEQGEKKFIRLN
jgi:YihY family inner membrane protein